MRVARRSPVKRSFFIRGRWGPVITARAVFAHGGQVWQGQARGLPFAESQLGGADFDAVQIVGGAVAQSFAPRWVDLAGVAVGTVHGWASCDEIRLLAHSLNAVNECGKPPTSRERRRR